MQSDRNLGVTEVRLGLAIFTCLLVALGYYVLHNLGESLPRTPGSPRPAEVSPNTKPEHNYEQPPILMVQGTEASPAPYPQTTMRPIWLAPQQDPDNTRPPAFRPNDSAEDVVEPNLFREESPRHW